MLEAIYAFSINWIMGVKALFLICLGLIVMQSNYFADRPKWRIGFLISGALLFVGLAGDIMDGLSELSELRFWAVLRHIGAASLFGCVLGMHWTQFAPVLFQGSKLFDNPVMRKLFRYEE